MAVREQHGQEESIFVCMPLPAAVVFVESAADVQDMVRICARYKVPIIAYGAGTSIEGHLLAVQGGVSVYVSRMNQVLRIHAEDMTVTVQPGVARKQLNEALKSMGLFSRLIPAPMLLLAA